MKGYREVAVRLSGKNVSCEPDPAVLYFRKGPDCVRFTFAGVPKEVASVVIRWKDPSRPPVCRLGHGALLGGFPSTGHHHPRQQPNPWPLPLHGGALG